MYGPSASEGFHQIYLVFVMRLVFYMIYIVWGPLTNWGFGGFRATSRKFRLLTPTLSVKQTHHQICIYGVCIHLVSFGACSHAGILDIIIVIMNIIDLYLFLFFHYYFWTNISNMISLVLDGIHDLATTFIKFKLWFYSLYMFNFLFWMEIVLITLYACGSFSMLHLISICFVICLFVYLFLFRC